MDRDDVEVLGKDDAYTGYFRIDRYHLRHRQYAGGWGEPMAREVFERGHAVGIVLYDPDRDVLVLIEQFRIGAFVAAQDPRLCDQFSPWLIEVVAGIIDTDESMEEVARREAVEEAGCTVGELRKIGVLLASPGGTTETVTLYLGLVEAPAVGGIHGLAHEHEDIRVLIASPDEVYGWLDAGRVVNGPSLVALQWFRIHQDDIRRKGQAAAAE